MNLSKVKLKTLLIFPNICPLPNEKITDERIKHLDQLGIATIAGYLKFKKYDNLSTIDLTKSHNFKNIKYYDYFNNPLTINQNKLIFFKKIIYKKDILYKFVKEILSIYKPNIVGFSVSYFTQYYSTLLLSRIIKKIDKNIFIVWGGTFATKKFIFGKGFNQTYNKFIDAVIINEGEEPMAKLIYNLANKKKLCTVPNLYFKKADGKFIRTKYNYSININNLLIPPQLEGIKGDYISLRMSIGCYWKRCTFCNHKKYFKKHRYQLVDLKKLVELIKQLQFEYKINTFLFNDQSIPPSCLKKFSQLLIKEKINIKWGCHFLCLDAGFNNKKTCYLMKLSGFFYAGLGLESMSPRILKLMNKIHTPRLALKILKAFNQVEINDINLQMMYNFPTETVKELVDTLNFLKKYKYLYNNIYLNKYYLNKDSYIYSHPKEFGIKKIKINNQSILKQRVADSIKFGVSRKDLGVLREKEYIIKRLAKELKIYFT